MGGDNCGPHDQQVPCHDSGELHRIGRDLPIFFLRLLTLELGTVPSNETFSF